jgi:intracellular sulfur oxidation DsrE/DsrF family protein
MFNETCIQGGRKMEGNLKKTMAVLIAAVFLVLSGLSFAWAEEYDAMKGVDAVNVMFDMRDGIPELALVHVKLIHETYKQLSAMGKAPVFVVVFMGSAVKLISSEQSAFSAEEKEVLKELAGTISKMSREGIDFEVCLAAVHYFGIDPASIQSEMKQVPNGWVSEIGYQARGYSLVPVY